MDRRMKEAVRYLGYGRNTADERTRMMIEDAFPKWKKQRGRNPSAAFLM